ncbi:hypothetical protein OG417_47810 [Actinoallomurus sp. NBC_01490]|uniref:hypothetical protein n=1 Tax=Actinoallomurus sp. NBC_01490 TaxID=2903557 RepID=UPI002E37E0D8|nr:hypothetical protein [Actinoallomurus sp. NBC_01490]
MPSPPTPPLAGIRIGLCRGISYGLLDSAEHFMPAMRSLGSRLVRVNLYWSQVEPEPGRFTWDVVDAFLGQLDPGDEAWVTVCSSSPWATRRATRFLPSSPARDLAEYRRFVGELVRHCGGAVHFWQCENEPCVPLLWVGGADEYLAQLTVFSQVVRKASPDALVVLGAAVPAAMFARESDGDERRADYFERIVRGGGDQFDLFDVHPYGDPYAIPALIEACGSLLAAHGAVRPIVVGEHNGPMPTAFPQNLPHLGAVLAEHRNVFLGRTTLPDGGLDFDRETPAVADLYRRMDDLPPTLRMFMAGCPAELAERRDRILREELVIRTVLLLAGGVRRVACFQLAPEAPDTGGRLNVRSLMFDAFALMDYENGTISARRPAAETFALMARELADACEVRRLATDRPGLHLYEIRRETRGPAYVAWSRDGETAHIPVPWRSTGRAGGVTALGEDVPVRSRGDEVVVPVTATPVIVGPGVAP